MVTFFLSGPPAGNNLMGPKKQTKDKGGDFSNKVRCMQKVTCIPSLCFPRDKCLSVKLQHRKGRMHDLSSNACGSMKGDGTRYSLTRPYCFGGEKPFLVYL